VCRGQESVCIDFQAVCQVLQAWFRNAQSVMAVTQELTPKLKALDLSFKKEAKACEQYQTGAAVCPQTGGASPAHFSCTGHVADVPRH